MFSSFIIIPYILQFYNTSRCSCIKTESKPKFDRKTNQNKCVIINTASGYKLLDLNYWAWIPPWIDCPMSSKNIDIWQSDRSFLPTDNGRATPRSWQTMGQGLFDQQCVYKSYWVEFTSCLDLQRFYIHVQWFPLVGLPIRQIQSDTLFKTRSFWTHLSCSFR